MWLTRQCGATVGLWLASPAEGCPGRRRGLGIGRRRRPSIGMVGGRAVWAGRVVTFDMSGLVWCKPGRLAGISGCAGLLWVGWRAAEVVTELPQVMRNMVGRREIR